MSNTKVVYQGSAWGDLKETLIRKRGWKCEWCGQLQTHLELHHMLFHRDRRYPQLDCAENCMLVCKACHESGMVNSWQAREWFWKLQTDRGYDMAGWIEGLPVKIKPKFG